MVFNPLAWDRNDIVQVTVELPPGTKSFKMNDTRGRTIPVQFLYAERRSDGSLASVNIIFIASNVPSLGYTSYYLEPLFSAEDASTNKLKKEKMLKATISGLENNYLRINLQNGAIGEIYDKRSRQQALHTKEVLGNEIFLYQDRGCCSVTRPVGKPEKLSLQEHTTEVTETGPVRATVRTITNFGNSRFERYIHLYPDSRRIDLETNMDWHDRAKRVRVCFPTSFQKGRIFSEVPFGVVEQPASLTPVVRWLELVKPDLRYGFTLINTGTPSYEVVNDSIYMTLFRSIDPNNIKWGENRDIDCDWCMTGRFEIKTVKLKVEKKI